MFSGRINKVSERGEYDVEKNKDIEVRVEETVKVIQGKEYEVHQLVLGKK